MPSALDDYAARRFDDCDIDESSPSFGPVCEVPDNTPPLPTPDKLDPELEQRLAMIEAYEQDRDGPSAGGALAVVRAITRGMFARQHLTSGMTSHTSLPGRLLVRRVRGVRARRRRATAASATHASPGRSTDDPEHHAVVRGRR